jgi:hypothetical protein
VSSHASFPGYVLIKLDLTDETGISSGAAKVTGFLGGAVDRRRRAPRRPDF